MTTQVTIVDYGIGNLYSVRRAFEACGAEVRLAEDLASIENAERLVLPGVGAFADGMLGLRERGLVEPIKRFGASGRPLLGICLGMQMLATRSEEFGEHDGLGLIPGRVVAVPATGTDGRQHKIPNIGWSPLRKPAALSGWDGSILSEVEEGAAVYLVHSYTVVPDDVSHRLADCSYDGLQVAAAIRAGAIYGCQFHPEKSGPVGLRIVSRFLRMS